MDTDRPEAGNGRPDTGAGTGAELKRIKSFTVDHMTLLPGVYVSRRDAVSPSDAFDASGVFDAPPEEHGKFPPESLYPIRTYDIRMTRPNFEPVMGTGEIHAIEHLGATWLRNRKDLKTRMLYWGPMGCRTGFYLILAGEMPVSRVVSLMIGLFTFVRDYEGDIPGATPEECGNYSDMDPAGAKKRAESYLTVLRAFAEGNEAEARSRDGAEGV